MDSTKISKRLAEEIGSWHASQQGQTSGYDFEKSFVALWSKLGKEVLQESLGEVDYDKNKKKK